MSFDPNHPEVMEAMRPPVEPVAEGGRFAAFRRAGAALKEELTPDVTAFNKGMATAGVIGVAGAAGVIGVSPAQASGGSEGKICEELMLGDNAIRNIKANYDRSKTSLSVRASAARYLDCDTDGPTRLNPSGDGDIGDRTFVVFRQVKSRVGQWKTDKKVVRFTNSEVVGTPMKPDGSIVIGKGINTSIKTALCKRGTKYRPAVKVIWDPDNGPAKSRIFTGKAKSC